MTGTVLKVEGRAVIYGGVTLFEVGETQIDTAKAAVDLVRYGDAKHRGALEVMAEFWTPNLKQQLAPFRHWMAKEDFKQAVRGAEMRTGIAAFGMASLVNHSGWAVQRIARRIVKLREYDYANWEAAERHQDQVTLDAEMAKLSWQDGLAQHMSSDAHKAKYAPAKGGKEIEWDDFGEIPPKNGP